jgi:hypothetical protein
MDDTAEHDWQDFSFCFLLMTADGHVGLGRLVYAPIRGLLAIGSGSSIPQENARLGVALQRDRCTG